MTDAKWIIDHSSNRLGRAGEHSTLLSFRFTALLLFGANDVFAEYDAIDAKANLQVPPTIMSDFPGEQITLPSLNLGLLYRDVEIPGPRELDKAEKRINELEQQLAGANKKQQARIKQKIQNIRKTAAKNAKGETHHRRH